MYTSEFDKHDRFVNILYCKFPASFFRPGEFIFILGRGSGQKKGGSAVSYDFVGSILEINLECGGALYVHSEVHIIRNTLFLSMYFISVNCTWSCVLAS